MLDTDKGVLYIYNSHGGNMKVEKPDPLIEELRIIMKENNWGYRKIALELSVHYQTVFGWFKRGTLSQMSRRIIKQYLISRL